MKKVLGVLMTIMGLFSLPDDLLRAYSTTQQLLSTNIARWIFVLLGVALLLADKWRPHVPSISRVIAMTKIRLCGLKNLKQLSHKGLQEDSDVTKASTLRGDLDRNMAVLHLCDLIAGGYVRAWRFNRVKGTLEVLMPERLSVIRSAIGELSSDIYIKGTELTRARNDYDYDQRVISQFKN